VSALPELSALTDADIVGHITHAKRRMAIARDEIAYFETELTARYAGAKEAYFQDRLSGDHSFTGTSGLRLKASISKTVKWDSEKLKAIAAKMPWDLANEVFEIEFSVPEARYQNMTDAALKHTLTGARTTKYGDLKVTVVSDNTT
jgi:hypothetical protein